MIAWDSLVPGAEPPPTRFGPISRTDIVRYQGASGDFQPIHHDEPFALAAGYSAPLVVGMLPAGVLTAWATAWLGAENVRKVRIRWREQVWPGDVIICSGRITERDDLNRRIGLELTGEKAGGGIAVQVWMTFDLSGANS